jgi:hypothetical protein
VPTVAFSVLVSTENFKLETRVICQLVEQLNFCSIFEKLCMEEVVKTL